MRLIVLVLFFIQQAYSQDLTCTKEYKKVQYQINNFNVIECNCECTMQNNKFFIKNADNIIYEVSEVSKILPSVTHKFNVGTAIEYFIKDKQYCNHQISIKKDNLYFFTLVPFDNKYCYELSAYTIGQKIKIIKDYVRLVTHAKIEVEKALLYMSPNNFSKSNGYLLKNDKIEILKEEDNWVYIVYYGMKKTNGWIRKENIISIMNNNLLHIIKKNIKQKKDLNTYNKEFFRNLLPEKPIEKKTLTPYNNIAYYLQKANANKEAIYLLEKILSKFPNRTVAHYNIADAYWAINDKKKAKEHYNIYIKQMKVKGKSKRIPKVVKDRVASK